MNSFQERCGGNEQVGDGPRARPTRPALGEGHRRGRRGDEPDYRVRTAAGRNAAGLGALPFFMNVQGGSLITFPPFMADSCARMPTHVMLAD